MENYREIKRLGRGAQGCVYQVNSKIDNKDYVLKKVECCDETDANKAFKEAVALQKLRHRYICGYKDFFVKWDKEEAAMYICIVMDYYEMGDLSKLLKKNRSKHEELNEMILKKWFGQMLEALVFVHNKHVIHRDLKPSNIFLTEDLNIYIGDFGVATVMSDFRTTTRTTVGSMNWMAPEVLHRPYDERSDVWSLGCILLEMATCGFLDVAEISDVLCDIKTKPQALESALETVIKSYTPSLCQIIRTMLRLNFQQRPSASDLVELPFVQECLKIIDSPLLNEKEDHTMELKKGVIITAKVPKDKGVQGVLAYMEENKACVQSLSKGLKVLMEYVKKGNIVSNVEKRKLGELMRKHIGNEEIQILSCRLFAALATEAEDEDALCTQKMISPVALAMKSHPGSANLQAAATQLLMALSADESASIEIGKLGGVQDLLAALRTFPSNVEIATYCCSALWSLAIDEGNAKILTEECGLQDICKAMNTHENAADLIEAACSAIWSLSMEDENIEMMADVGAIQLILKALKTHKKEAKVVKNACMALATISEADEGSAFEILRGDESTTGCAILVEAFKLHQENEEVVENFACCVAELAEYEDLRNEMKAKKVHEVLADIKLKFITNQDVMSQINKALSAMGEGEDVGKYFGI